MKFSADNLDANVVHMSVGESGVETEFMVFTTLKRWLRPTGTRPPCE